jgi:hypothetical protein
MIAIMVFISGAAVGYLLARWQYSRTLNGLIAEIEKIIETLDARIKTVQP